MVDILSQTQCSFDYIINAENANHFDDLEDILLSASKGIKIFSSLCVFGPFKFINLSFLQKFLMKHSLQFIYLNCLELYSEQIFLVSFFSCIKVYHHACIASNILNVLELFLINLKNSTLFFICDNTEYLLKYDSRFFSSLICMLEQPSCYNICIICLSEIPLNTSLNMHPFKDAIQLYIPPFSKVEICQFILGDTPKNHNVLHTSFLQNMWHLFSIICQNHAEFILACCENFPYYIEPIETSKISSQDPRLLWKMLESELIRKYTFQTDQKLLIPCFLNTFSYFCRISFISRILLISAYLSSHSILKLIPKRCSTYVHSMHCKPITYFPDDIPAVPFTFDKLIAVLSRVRGIHTPCSVNLLTLITTLTSIQLFIHAIPSSSWRNAQMYYSILNKNTHTMLCKSINLPLIEDFQ